MKMGRQLDWYRVIAVAITSFASFATISFAHAGDVESVDSTAEEPSSDAEAKARDTIVACRLRFEQVDAQIDAAGVRDVSYFRVPGYPYMRGDRLLASFEISDLKELDPLGDWMHQLRDNEGFARDVELQNMGIPLRERVTLLSELRLCAVWLSHLELGQDPAREKLVSLVHPPLEPLDHGGHDRLTDAQTEKEIKKRAELTRKRFAVPVDELDSPGKLVLWKVKPIDPDQKKMRVDGFEVAFRDALGRVGLTENHWEQLASRYAPALLIETAGKTDRIGTPRLGEQGPFVDVTTPVVDFQADYARLGSQTLVQFNYFIWFPGPAAGDDGNEGDAAKVDGLIWRVTLDANGSPIAYDAIDAGGFDHLLFPLPSSLHLRPEARDDTVLIPQPEVPAEFVVRLGDGGHEVQRLIAADSVQASEVQEYELRRYEKLLTLPQPDGGTASLFGPDGTIAGSGGAGLSTTANGSEPTRQWGRHPVSLRADLYFDDPRLLERYFKPVSSPKIDTGKKNPVEGAPTAEKAEKESLLGG